MVAKLAGASRLVIKIKGQNRFAFINACSRRGIPLWSVTSQQDETLLVTTVTGFSQMRKSARETKTVVSVVERRGVSLIKYKLRKRSYFALGGLIFVLLLRVLSSFVWIINIDHSEHVSQEELSSSLSRAGLHVGVLKSSIARDDVANSLLIEYPQLVWASINIRGSRVHVTVVDRAMVEMPVSHPGDVVASRPGIIVKAIATNGQTLVASGDTVVRGQVLISGTVIVEDNTVAQVQAAGVVEAKGWYESVHAVHLKRLVGRPTGTRGVSEIISIADGTQVVLIGYKEPPFTHFEVEERKRVLLPGVEHISRMYREIILENETIDTEAALIEAVVAARAQIKGLFPDNSVAIVAEYVEHKLTEDTLSVRVLFEVIEDIGNFIPYPVLNN